MSDNVYPRIILGLDVSTACIGVCIIKDDGSDKPEILYLTHKTPKIPRKINGFEALYMKKNVFEEEVLKDIATAYTVTDVVIEEPLISSNNANTVATLLRFNGMVAEAVCRILGVIPNFISSHDARLYSFPELACARRVNMKGNPYDIRHVRSAIRKDDPVLFGAYPFDADKKTIMMSMVDRMYSNGIEWARKPNGEFRKENYDACDSLVCALAYMNVNHHGVEKVVYGSMGEKEQPDGSYVVKYTTHIWGREYFHEMTVPKAQPKK